MCRNVKDSPLLHHGQVLWEWFLRPVFLNVSVSLSRDWAYWRVHSDKAVKMVWKQDEKEDEVEL